jgi:hypothetical protein
MTNLQSKSAQRFAHDLSVLVRVRGNVVVAAVGHTQTAANVYMADIVTVRAQLLHQLCQNGVGLAVRLQRGDLRADVHVDAGNAQVVELRSPGINLTGPAHRNAELVL